MGCANAVLHPFRKDMQFMQASIDNVVLSVFTCRYNLLFRAAFAGVDVEILQLIFGFVGVLQIFSTSVSWNYPVEVRKQLLSELWSGEAWHTGDDEKCPRFFWVKRWAITQNEAPLWMVYKEIIKDVGSPIIFPFVFIVF